MALTSIAKLYINQFLQIMNLRLDTLTAQKTEQKRLDYLDQSGQFDRPVFPVPESFTAGTYASILDELVPHERRFASFKNESHNDVGYTFENGYFSSPDTEILYTMIRKFHPETIIEIGSGNSTKIARQAIRDSQSKTRLISIDPFPRSEISKLSDEIYLNPVEGLGNLSTFQSLKAGDILFIDSSHSIKTGNDVVFLYLNVLPKLSSGVLIHIHDIFLPYDYPRAWVIDEGWGWNEQYLVQSFLMLSDAFEVMWPGHFLQRTQKDFAAHFPNLGSRIAKSLWLRKK